MKAIDQAIRAIGMKQFPIIKYHPGSNDVCIKMFIKKEIESGIHGFATPIHDIPTKIYNRFLYLEYFERIEIPIMTEIITKIKEKEP